MTFVNEIQVPCGTVLKEVLSHDYLDDYGSLETLFLDPVPLSPMHVWRCALCQTIKKNSGISRDMSAKN